MAKMIRAYPENPTKYHEIEVMGIYNVQQRLESMTQNKNMSVKILD